MGDHQDWLVRMLREVALLEKLKHPNIIEYKHAWVEEHQLSKVMVVGWIDIRGEEIKTQHTLTVWT